MVFFGPGGRDVETADGAIDAQQLTIDAAEPIEAVQQGVADAGPGAVGAPAVEAV
jgi:hypothetical protein